LAETMSWTSTGCSCGFFVAPMRKGIVIAERREAIGRGSRGGPCAEAEAARLHTAAKPIIQAATAVRMSESASVGRG
jgi:hypothetical protein